MEVNNKLNIKRLQGPTGLKSCCIIHVDRAIMEKYDYVPVSETKKHGNSKGKLLYLVAYYFSKSRYRKALGYVNILISLEPQNAEHYYNAGTLYAKIRKYNDALDALRKAIALGFSSFYAYYNIALVYMIQRNYDEAIKSYTEAITIKKDDALSYYNRGELYCIKNEILLAIADLKRVVEIDEDAVMAWADMGELNYYIGNYNEAVENKKQAALKNRTYQGAYKSMLVLTSVKMKELYDEGLRSYKNKDFKKARSKIEKVLEIYPDYSEAKDLLSKINQEDPHEKE